MSVPPDRTDLRLTISSLDLAQKCCWAKSQRSDGAAGVYLRFKDEGKVDGFLISGYFGADAEILGQAQHSRVFLYDVAVKILVPRSAQWRTISE